jgi:serine protease Do
MKAASMRSCVTAIVATLALATMGFAQERKTREELVQEDRANFGDVETWIYNDLERGYKSARESGKPLLVVFRCVPCEACAQLDEEIVERDPRVRALLDQYVCVRVVHANGMDLERFQFDYDQSFAAFLMNGDGTIYGRYGTRSHQTESEGDVSIEGFAEALEAGLLVHASYPNNRNSLSGKQSHWQPPHRRPEDFPQLQKYGSTLDYVGEVVPSCIHCHQVGETLHAIYRDNGEAIPDERLFPYPHPKMLGLIMDPKRAATVLEVEPDSLAERSGFRVGDALMSFGGQPPLSIADVQWVLQQAGDEDRVAASVRRGGETIEIELELASGWRREGDISWRATSWALRRMTTGGMLLKDLSDAAREERDLPLDSLALEAIHVGEYGEHALAKNQGFLKGDVLVEVAGMRGRMSESELFAALVNRPIGTSFPVRVRRERGELDFTLNTQK